MRSTLTSRVLKAPRERVYQVLLDPERIAKWRVPTGMTAVVHEFEPHEGGRVRISLSYNVPTTAGKTTPQMDTYHGRFLKLVPNTQVVETSEFETADPELQGVMTSTITLTGTEGGTRVDVIHEGLPNGLSPEDNAQGWREALDKLAVLVETGEGDPELRSS